jgi:arylsulfatase A-like enzyme
MLHHGRWLHEELVRVPLYVAAPGWPAGKVVDASCSLMDVVPTVLELVGLPRPEGIDGRSLVPLVEQGAPGRPSPSEERRTDAETGFPEDDVSLFGLRDGRWKWVRAVDHRTSKVLEEVWDLEADPATQRPLPPGSEDRLPAAFREAIRARPK